MTDAGLLKTGPKDGAAETRSGATKNEPTLKMFEREDWTLFRTVEGLQQKAGVPANRLRPLVLKEVGDNALDTGAAVRFGQNGSLDRFYVEDDGPGLDGTPEQIAELFSIRRPLRSSKLLRCPQRGQLGNGLRVVAGAVLASGGSLAAVTRGRRITLRPEPNGSTSVVKVAQAKSSAGTRIEIGFGAALPIDPDPFVWVRAAESVAGAGDHYQGRSSPFWYDAAQFHELMLAFGAQPVRSLIAELDGCTGGKAGEIVGVARLGRLRCEDVNRRQATKLLEIARAHVRPVTPERLGHVGRGAFPDYQYAVKSDTTELGSTRPQAVIPYVVEAWARSTSGRVKKPTDDVDVSVLINRTPITSEVSAWRDSERDLCLQGSGLSHCCSDAPKKGSYDVILHITTPYCPITSDGKAPHLDAFAGHILVAIEEAMRKAQRAAPKDKKLSQKDVVLDNLDEAIAEVGGGYRFGERQLLYWLRPIVRRETGQDLREGNFKKHPHQLRGRERRDPRHVSGAARLDLPSASPRDHSTRDPDGREISAPGLDLQQGRPRREGRVL
jgi:hypothetical protein